MSIQLSGRQCDRLLDYLVLLQKWNRSFNLTAVRDPQQMVARQLLDSLSILPLLRGPRVLDVGSGPGLPGIPLAIARPDFQITLLDANGKKTRFLEQARMYLELENVEVVRSRVEAFHPSELYDTLTSRAFSSLQTMETLTSHLLRPTGLSLAMKGTLPDEEIAALEKLGCRPRVLPLEVPGTEGKRHAVCWEKSDTG